MGFKITVCGMVDIMVLMFVCIQYLFLLSTCLWQPQVSPWRNKWWPQTLRTSGPQVKTLPVWQGLKKDPRKLCLTHIPADPIPCCPPSGLWNPLLYQAQGLIGQPHILLSRSGTVLPSFLPVINNDPSSSLSAIFLLQKTLSCLLAQIKLVHSEISVFSSHPTGINNAGPFFYETYICLLIF